MALARAASAWAGSLLLVWAALPAAAQDAATRTADPPRPRIGLALGGGGARGAAHIGVLEALESLRVPVDCIAGTSMGAVVAGAFAAGVSPAQMRAAMARADWKDMFIDSPDWAERNFRSKQLTQRFLSGAEIGVTPQGLQYLPGVLTGQKIKLFLNQLVYDDRVARNIEALPLPLSIIATDIGSGERVVMREASLTQAMRASMAIPGLMAPVERNGRLLVDGGLVDNVPVREVRERCNADVVIAVNVGSPLLDAKDVASLFSVAAQMVGILTEQNVSQSLDSLKPDDVYIKPNLLDIAAADFERHADAARQGRIAVQAVAQRLRALALSDAQYAHWWARTDRERGPPLRVDAIEVSGLPQLHPAAVLRHVTQPLGQPLNTQALNRDLLRIYGDAHYEGVDYALIARTDRNVLQVSPSAKRWGPDFLRFAAGLNSTLRRGSTYSLRGAYHKTLMNRFGADLMLTGELGSTTGLAADFYQPLDPWQRSFVEVGLRAARTTTNVFEGEVKVSEYLVRSHAASVAVGLNLGVAGQVRLGWLGQEKYYEIDTGVALFPRGPFHTPGWFSSVDFDQLNDPDFPSAGWAAKLAYFVPTSADFTRVTAQARAATTGAGIVFAARVSYTGSPRGVLPFHEAASLGGLLNLSAFGTDQLLGDGVSFAQIRAEKVIRRLPIGLSGDLRAGVALEAGRVGTRYTETALSGWQDSILLYLGGPTPIGPLYLGYGHSSRGRSNAYLFIGSL
jgi:NTE family protein